MKPKVLFICIDNSARSEMAEAQHRKRQVQAYNAALACKKSQTHPEYAPR